MRHWLVVVGFQIALFVGILGSSCALAEAQDASPALPGLVGHKAPEFSVRSLDGKSVSLGDFRGKVILVSFWATWCGSCLEELPWLAELREKYAPKGFEVLGVLTNNMPPEKLRALLERDKVGFPIVMCNHSVAQAYGGLPYLPASFYISRSGSVVREAADVKSKAELERFIQAALQTR